MYLVGLVVDLHDDLSEVGVCYQRIQGVRHATAFCCRNGMKKKISVNPCLFYFCVPWDAGCNRAHEGVQTVHMAI